MGFPQQVPALLKWVKVDQATATTADLIAAVAGKTIKVWQMFLRNGGVAQNLTILDGATDLTEDMGFAVNSGEVWPYGGHPWLECTAGNALRLTTTQASQVSGRIGYTNDPITTGMP